MAIRNGCVWMVALAIAGCGGSDLYRRANQDFRLGRDHAAQEGFMAFINAACHVPNDGERCATAHLHMGEIFLHTNKLGPAAMSFSLSLYFSPNAADARRLLDATERRQREVLIGPKEGRLLVVHVERVPRLVELTRWRVWIDGQDAVELDLPAGLHAVDTAFEYRGIAPGVRGRKFIVHSAHSVAVPKGSRTSLLITTYLKADLPFDASFAIDNQVEVVPLPP